MAGSQFGKIFHISTFGESHGKALGVVVDGCPAGLSLSEEDIQEMLERRRPGKNLKMTQRKEGDKVEILSGIFEGKTTGTPIAMVVWNEDQRSKDYGEIARAMRITAFLPNTVFGIIGGEVVPPEGKPLPEWRREPLPRKCFWSWGFPSGPRSSSLPAFP